MYGTTSPDIWTTRCPMKSGNRCSGLEHCEICSAILDSTRNILVLTADNRVFELPVGFSDRLHSRLAREMESGSGGKLGHPDKPPPSELNGAVEVQMENPLHADEQQRYNCQPDLNRLRAFLLRRRRNHSPLRGGSRPKTPNPPDRVEIYQ